MMPNYLRAFARAPSAVQDRPDAAAIRRLERFLGFVDEKLAARDERVALRLANGAIAIASRGA